MFHKRLVCGFNGYQVPPTPRATRTPRKRIIPRRKTDENQLCAFDLLPTVALNLLLEGNEKHFASLKDSIKKEEHKTDKPLNAKSSFFDSGLVSRTLNLNNYTEEHPHAQGDAGSWSASVKTTSDCSVKIDSPEQIVSDGDKFLLGSSTRIAGNEVSVSKVSSSCKLDCENKAQIENESADKGKVSVRSMANMCNANGLVTVNTNPLLLVNSDRSIKFPSSKDHISGGSFSVNREGVKLGIRDDDENSWCTQSNTVNKAFRPCNEDRISNSVSSHCCKVPDMEDGHKTDMKEGHKTDMKDEHRHFDADMDRRHFSQDNKHSFKGERPLSDYPIKKRKLYGYSSLSNSSGGTNGEDCDSTPKGSHRNGPASLGTLTGVTGIPASSTIEQTSPRCRDSHVKLKIKSFHVPELFIDIPEAATVASLKRTVMEAVTAILGNGIHVGVLVQGKKIRDDNRTLLQTGISDINKPDALGFMLEPNHSPTPASVYAKGHPFLRVCESPKSLARYVDAQSLVHSSAQHKAAVMSTNVPESNFTNFVESDHESAPSPPDMTQEKSAVDSRALVPVPPTNVESLNMVPVRKPKRSEFARRRIRRPFTVSEVEALVHAVEKLGTGRWRDVKMWAFGNVKHRTYVDLKDKWKTLVHTARISPQQRRGYPVPQELLDRVLLAHAYWSQQQAKQQLKRNSRSSPSPLKVKFVETPQSHFLMKGDFVVG